MTKKVRIAVLDKNNRFKWDDKPNKTVLRKSYKRNPDNFHLDRGTGILYLLELNLKRLNQSYSASLKIAGSNYALALMLTKAKKDKEWHHIYQMLQSKGFARFGTKFPKLFENLIKNYGLFVGMEIDEDIRWAVELELPIKLERIKLLYRTQPDMFYIIDKKLYYLRCYQETIQDMFFKCVELAGGERQLAKALATDGRTEQINIMNFKRLGFKQTKTFAIYAELFSKYLERNISLFDHKEMTDGK